MSSEITLEVGKKYTWSHTNGIYIKILNHCVVDSNDYYTVERRYKNGDSLYDVACFYKTALKGLILYVKTKKITHEKWICWYKFKNDGKVYLCQRDSKYELESFFNPHPAHYTKLSEPKLETFIEEVPEE